MAKAKKTIKRKTKVTKKATGKKEELKMFVMIGARNSKGRIVKNKNLSLEEFGKLVSPVTIKLRDKVKNIKNFDRIFNTKKYKMYLEEVKGEYAEKAIKQYIKHLVDSIKLSIILDNLGRTPKKKSKK